MGNKDALVLGMGLACLGLGQASAATQHFIFGLAPGQACDIYQGTTLLLQGVSSGNAGALTFQATGGGTFQILATGGIVDLTAPSGVTNLAVSGTTATSATLGWTSVGDDGGSGQATSYDLRYSTSPISDVNWALATQVPGEPSPKVAGQSETMTVSGLAGGTTYYFALKVADEVPNIGPLSNVASGTTLNPTDTTPPSAVSNLAVSTTTTTTATLTWTAVGDDGTTGKATTYDLRYSTSQITSGSWTSAAQVSGEPAPKTAGQSETFTITGLSSGTTYYFALKVADEVPNWSGLSNVPSGSTPQPGDTTPPSAVTTLAVTATTGNSATLAWTSVGDDGATGQAATYDLRYSTALITSANWTSATQVSGEPSPKVAGQAESFTVSSLQSGTTYYFALKVADEVPNWSGLSNVPSGATVAAGDNTPPAGVTTLAVTSTTGSSVSLSWTAVGDDGNTGTAHHYDLRYALSPITSQSQWNAATYAPSEPLPKAPGQTEVMTVSGLQPNTTYHFALKVADEVPNWSALSNSPSGRTQGGADTTPPATVSNLAVTGTTATSASLSWTAPGDDGTTGTAHHYDLRYATSPITTQSAWNSATYASGEPAPLAPGQTQTMTVSGLLSNRVYYFAVKTADEVPNWSGLSNSPQGTTLPGPDVTAPSPVTSLSISATSQTSLTLSWTATGDDGQSGRATSYDLRYSNANITSGNWNAATQASGEPAPAVSGQGETFVLSGLTPNTPYFVALKVGDEIPNWSGISNVASGRTASNTDALPPSPVTDLTVTAAAVDGLRLRWTATGDDGASGQAASYELRRSGNPITNSNWGAATLISGVPGPAPAGTTEELWVYGLAPSSRFYFGIKVKDDVGNPSTLSNIPSGTTLPEVDVYPPIRVGDLASSHVDSASVEVAWTAPYDTLHAGTRVGAYEIRVHTATIEENGTGHRILTGPMPQDPGMEETFHITGLLPSTQYFCRVRSRDVAGNWSHLSNQIAVVTTDGPPPPTDTTPPSAVNDLRAPQQGPDWVDLAWTAPGDDGAAGAADRYEVRRATFPITAVTWDLATLLTGAPAPHQAGSTEVMEVSGLSVDATHYFALKTSDEAGNTSAISNVLQVHTVRPLDTGRPETVLDLTIVDSTEVSLTLTWTTPADSVTPWAEGSGFIQEYDLRYRVGALGEGDWEDATAVPAPEAASSGVPVAWVVVALAPGTSYAFGLKSRDEAGNESDLSNIAVAATRIHIDPPLPDSIAPGGVTALRFEATAPDLGMLRWTATGDDEAVGQASAYRVRRMAAADPAELDPNLLVWSDADSMEVPFVPAAAGEAESLATLGLTPGTAYSFGVRALDEEWNEGMVVWSDAVVMPWPADTLPPESVADLKGEVLSDSSIATPARGAASPGPGNPAPTHASVRLRWTAPADPRPLQPAGVIAGYRVLRSDWGPDSTDWAAPSWDSLLTRANGAGLQESLTVKGLDRDRTFHFALLSVDKSGNWSALSNVERVIVPPDSSGNPDPPNPDTTPPAAVSTLDGYAVRADSIQVTWRASGDDGLHGRARRYELRYSSQEITAESWGALDSIPAPAPAEPGTNQAIGWGGRAALTTYHIAIRVLDEVGNRSPLSNLITVRTPEPQDLSPPGVPQGMTTAWVTDRVMVEWLPSPEPDFASYDLYRREENEASPALIAQGLTGTILADSTVDGGHTYGYSATARDRAGNVSARSAEVLIPVPLVPIGTPGAPAVTLTGLIVLGPDLRTNRLEFRWSVEAGDDLIGFHVYREADGAPARERRTEELLMGEGPHSYVEPRIPEPGLYRYYLVAFGTGGGTLEFDPVEVDVPEWGSMFLGAFPNPTQGPLQVVFTVPAPATASLRLYDAAGRQVGTTRTWAASVGRNEWPVDLAAFGPDGLAQGVYLARFEAGATRQTVRLLYLRARR